jgi:hypothetical protein
MNNIYNNRHITDIIRYNNGQKTYIFNMVIIYKFIYDVYIIYYIGVMSIMI